MKPKFHKLPKLNGESFSVINAERYHSYNDWHYHAELEIIYIEKGEGTWFIGDKIGDIVGGELFLIGPNVPHMFRFDNHSYKNKIMKQGLIPLGSKMITLHADIAIFGNQFLSMPENESLSALYKASQRCLIFNDADHTNIHLKLRALMTADMDERLILLLQLFNLLARKSGRTFIISENYSVLYNEQDEKRLTKIYLYTLNNFKRAIKIKDVAAIVYMAPNAFCRYFKSRTQKSYITFLLEVRISHACKLLVNNDFSMIMITYECGISNMSNFNRHFKSITGKTPTEYRKIVKMSN